MNLHTARIAAKERDSTARVQNNLKTSCFEYMASIITSLVTVVILFTLFFRIVTVFGPSMLPTLQSGDHVVLFCWNYQPQHDDVVVITQTAGYDKPIIKRVIALENEVVDIDFKTGVISVNGKPLEESDYLKQGVTHSDFTFPLTVPQGHVFVLGDNRSVSNDSRYSDIGMIDERYILGKAQCVLFPFDRLGAIN